MNFPKRSSVSPAVLPLPSRRRGLRALALSLAALATGCGAGDDVQPWSDAFAKASSQSLSLLPVTCADIKAADPAATDGEYTVHIDGDALLPWTVWCHDMAGTPTEYLTLAQTGPDANYSQYLASSNAPGTTVRTTYMRLRIDPLTLKVNTADQRFSTSTGGLWHANTRVTSMPYGVAMTCNQSVVPARIDLRGTSFAVAPNAFAIAGAGPVGGTVYSEANQVVTLSGGGNCGWDAPVGSFNPFNQSGAQLQLRYRAEHLPATCKEISAADALAPDGEYTLYFNKDLFQPWSVWCHNMAGTPSEYLSLVQQGASSNYSQYTAGGYSPGTDVRTTFTRLRIDPLTLRVNTSDQTFSTSTGSLRHGSTQVTSMPYATAMGCDRWGMGNIDLRGTPFAVAAGQIGIGGVSTGGSTYSYSSGNQVVGLSGYGKCGWVAPVGSFNPFNQSGASLLLVYSGVL
ncbi:GON domain-containing protein [Hyalangium gracile]|uniref:GON domain-containing protein n=1 Tax=Hyalangium gracile TaxID=394092 RepID=UPI001CCC3C82|nr:GON domain-containing protein [Hyalangium gracile]